MNMSASMRKSGICGGRGGQCGGCDGSGRGRCREHGIPRKRINVCKKEFPT